MSLNELQKTGYGARRVELTSEQEEDLDQRFFTLVEQLEVLNKDIELAAQMLREERVEYKRAIEKLRKVDDES
jgi:hypothetical protein